MTDSRPKSRKPEKDRLARPGATPTSTASTKYVATDYATNPKAPVGQWCCAPTSTLGPFPAKPTANTESPNYCGQCVSYVKVLCPTMPATTQWSPGDLVKTSTTIAEGTVIANFDSANKYMGHAAIYVSKDSAGINVYDQWVSGAGKAIGPRKLTYGGAGSSNNGDLFYVVTS